MAGKPTTFKCAKCGISSLEDPTLVFHTFPPPSRLHGSLKARVWATYCYPNGDWSSIESLHNLTAQHRMICDKHFDESSFTSSSRKRLNNFAIPTDAQHILKKLRVEHNAASNKTQESTESNSSENLLEIEMTSSFEHVILPESSASIVDIKIQIEPCFQPSERRAKQHNVHVFNEAAEVQFLEVTQVDCQDDLNQVQYQEKNVEAPADGIRPPMITLPNYCRASCDTRTSACIFSECRSTKLQKIHLDIIVVVFQENNFYIPRGSRVCENHLSEPVWCDIERNCRQVSKEFSADHIEEILNIFSTRKVCLDFDRLCTMNNVIFYLYVGMTKVRFQGILERNPIIAEQFKKKAGTALAAFLTKIHTGGSHRKLSKIFKMSRDTFEKTITTVKHVMGNNLPAICKHFKQTKISNTSMEDDDESESE